MLSPDDRLMKIIPYPQSLEASVERLNERLARGGKGEYAFPESNQEAERGPHRSLQRDYFVAVDEGNEVRGGYILRHQPYFRFGQPFDLSFLKLPVSEGAVDSRYAILGIEILQDVCLRKPTTFALGMGGMNEALPKILQQLQWEVTEVPFFFKILRAERVLSELEVSQRTPLRRLLSKVAALSGAATIGRMIVHQRTPCRRNTSLEVEDSFGGWVDSVWESSKEEFGLLAERSSRTLSEIYLPFADAIRILRIRRDDTTIGWTACLTTQMENHPVFGNLRVSTIADGLSRGEHAGEVIHETVAFLEKEKPDLILSNQLNTNWQLGFTTAGFRRGPSNFALAISPGCAQAVSFDPDFWKSAHINRGDGDGPIHL